MRALLDVNVLLALFDPDHVDHARARSWLRDNIRWGWASCPITENGFVRVLSQPRYPGSTTPAAAISRLRRATDTEHHAFWPADRSVLDRGVVDSARLLGPRQVTDAYLLALAVERDGRLVTFDRRVPAMAVPGAGPGHLVVV